MSPYAMAVIAAVGIVIVILGISLWQRRQPRQLNTAYFQGQWQSIQALCGDSSTWPLAVINADKLLDEALKRRHFKGKTMGERLVSAQHTLNNNETVWFGHKLRNKLVHEEAGRLKKETVLNALAGFRQALKDLGAL